MRREIYFKFICLKKKTNSVFLLNLYLFEPKRKGGFFTLQVGCNHDLCEVYVPDVCMKFKIYLN